MTQAFQILSKYIAVFCLLVVSISAKAEFLVVVNPSVEVDSLSSQELAQIYALQVKNWQSSQLIKAYTFPSKHPDYKAFSLTVLRTQPHQLNRLWNRVLFTGTGNPPSKVSSSEDMLKMVRTNLGAIGYVKKHISLDLNGVKVLRVGQK